jgi:hypothetical protein
MVAVWNSNGFYFEGSNGFDPGDFHADALGANINIKVYKANGQLKAQSQQPTFNTEWLQFTAVAGESPYRLEVTPVAWPCSEEQVAVGWAYVTWNQP